METALHTVAQEEWNFVDPQKVIGPYTGQYCNLPAAHSLLNVTHQPITHRSVHVLESILQITSCLHPPDLSHLPYAFKLQSTLFS